MGKFIGDVSAVWAVKGHRMRILKDFKYIDDNDQEWIAPKGSVIDGASIPRAFWVLVGSPFVGKFRRASVIHDVYCVSRERPSNEVHRVFYEMCLCDGVSKFKAWIMYQAVKIGGPKWSS